MKYIITLTLAVSLILLTTESKAQMRLLAKAHRMYDSTGNKLEDSTTYFHSGAKGANPGKFKIPEFEYMEDSMHVFAKSGSSMKWVGRRISMYNGADFNYSTYYTWSDSANNWRNNLRTRIIYAGGKPDTVYYDTWSFNNWRPSTRIMYTWNGNNIATQTRQTRGFGGPNPPWTNRERLTYTWSGSNETELVIARWKSGAWEDSTKRSTTWVGGKITDVSTFKWSGSWNDDTKSTYAYDGNSRLVTIKRDIYTGVWEPNRIDTFIYTPTNGNYPDTMVRFAYFLGNFTNEGKFAYKNLPDGRLTEQLTMSWNGVDTWKQTNNQDSIDHWYYGWPASVENMEVANDRINVYPSPASQTIHITLDGVEPGKQVHLAIMDMQGRLVKNWADNARGKMSMTISELPAGNYILHATDGTFTAARQFVVVE